MREKINLKKSWYDGFIFDKFIMPNQVLLFNQLKKLIPNGAVVLDVGCATGQFEFVINDKASLCVGIDISSKNIECSKRKLEKLNYLKNRIIFAQSDFENFNSEISTFDICVFSFILHEIDFAKRINFINKASSLCKEIIIADYNANSKRRFWKSLEKFAEFLAGPEHFNNYKNYVYNGGIEGILKFIKNKYLVVFEALDKPRTAHIVKLRLS